MIYQLTSESVLYYPPDPLIRRSLIRTAGAIILRISHGYEVQEGFDPFVSLADLATEQFSISTSPGGFLVNLVPLRMKFL